MAKKIVYVGIYEKIVTPEGMFFVRGEPVNVVSDALASALLGSECFVLAVEAPKGKGSGK